MVRHVAALWLLVISAGAVRKSYELSRASEHSVLAVLLRTGGPDSPRRVESIMNTWARDLEPGALTLLQPDEECESKYGDNHWKGLTCLEAKNHVRLMNRTNFDWLLVVDDDTYVFPQRLRETLRLMDTSKAEVYGAPYCGDCGKGRKGFCGGGGYVFSRQSLLTMAAATKTPVSRSAGNAFVEHMMTTPMSEWCDVAFGCLAQDMGLKPVGVKGLYGNGIKDSEGAVDESEEGKVVELVSKKNHEAPLVLHNVRSEAHMKRLYEESLKQKEGENEKRTVYNKDGVGDIPKWSYLQKKG